MLQTLFDVIPVGIGIAEHPACRQIRANPALAEMLRIPVAANASLTAPQTGPPGRLQRVSGRPRAEPGQTPHANCRGTGGRVSADIELDLVFPHRTVVNLLEYVIPLFKEERNPKGSIGNSWTSRHGIRPRGRIQGGRSRTGELLAMLAHELRTPLSALGNAPRTSCACPLGRNRKRPVVTGSRRTDSDRTLVRFVDDLLDVSRILEGQDSTQEGVASMPGDARRTGLSEIGAPVPRKPGTSADHIMEFLRPLLFDGDPTTRPGPVEPLNNAAKYTDEGSQIYLSAGIENDEVVLRVRDTGIGIEPEMQSRVFDLFAQADGFDPSLRKAVSASA